MNDELGSIERRPPVPTNMPPTFKALKQAFEANKLMDYKRDNKKHWPMKLRNRCSRWLFVHEHMQFMAERLIDGAFEERMVRAADLLDRRREQGELTASKYIDEVLKPPTAKKRKRTSYRRQERGVFDVPVTVTHVQVPTA